MLFAICLVMFILSWLVCIGVTVAGVWATFSKAGRPGWACIVPVYGAIVFLDIAGKPWWWLFLLMIPLAGIVFGIIAIIAFTTSFGRGVGFALGLMFLGFVFWPLLGFGDADYEGA
jgi:hypothetical protein